MIDRLHHYIRELSMLRKAMEATKQQSQAVHDRKGEEELKVLKEETASLKVKIGSLKSDFEKKEKEAKAAKTEAEALKKQSEGLQTEYDRVVEDNQNLRSQLQSVDKTLSSSEEKKNM